MTTPKNAPVDPAPRCLDEGTVNGAPCQNYRDTCPYRGPNGAHSQITAVGTRLLAVRALSAPVVALCGPAAEDEIDDGPTDEVRHARATFFDEDAASATRAYDAACAAAASTHVRGAQAKTATNAAVVAHTDAVAVAQRAHTAVDNVRGAAAAALLPGHEADALIADITRRAANADYDVAQARAELIRAAVREDRADTASDESEHTVVRTRERADEAHSCARAAAQNAWADKRASQEWFDAIQAHIREVNG